MRNIFILNSIAEQELKTPCVIQLFSQKDLQGESKGQINRSQWVFFEDDDNDDNDDNDDDNDDHDDDDDDNDDDDDDEDENDENDGNNDNDDDNVKSVYSHSHVSGKCCWDVYSSSRYVLKYLYR